MSININTTHTITCTDAPVEEVLNLIYTDALDAANKTSFRVYIRSQIDALRAERNELQTRVADLTRESDEVQKRLEELWAGKKKLIADNKYLATRDEALDGVFGMQQMRINILERKLKEAEDATPSTGSRPALPKGMRLAEHEKYGRCVVSPREHRNGGYFVCYLSDAISSGWDWSNVDPSTLTFLEEEPSPAPLPKPEDCKAGELYLARAFGREVIAKRCHPMDGICPWVVSDADIHYANWCSDRQITLLARLLPDRKEQA
ncbi:hypothetical protein [Corynebacterium flavescens]|uniref:Uncharacterized protein n=1 Tax=Corynebacterium flavescens TaxID=28028 RepID=A0A1L7CNI2_CORFL|nr:hypothetical protein [Corynebacterium flavescens]APT87412.1 hypothetical protein CFLV_09645 [Corynebacterium flavescens]KAA8720500.1 hypothetical protein F4V60_09380 [Corynebacterium flavescens]GEB97734.1 hypothetical protein CFL01nite_12290 [Corynebacterium flavescens]